MFLLPQPREITYNEGNFNLTNSTEIILDMSCEFNDFENVKLLKKEIESLTGFSLKISKSLKEERNSIYFKRCSGESESYEINISENIIKICASSEAGLLYAVNTLRQIIRLKGTMLPCLNILDKPYFKIRGFYHDITRGKVPTLETLKELCDRLSFYKINQLQLYIEHTFAFKELSEVWMDKDPLTAEEVLELDMYCRKRSIELVPSISTFGHLYEVLRSQTFNHLCELNDSRSKKYSWYDRMAHHTLDASNPESLEFVKGCIDEYLPLFSSNKFNICCDETFDLGKGRSAALKDKIGTGKLYVNFLNDIIKHVKSYNKEVMFWGDIIVKYPEYLKEIPKDVICLNWAYHESVTEDNTRKIAHSGIKQYVCPGVSGWNRLMNLMEPSFVNINKMISYGRKYKAEGVLNTDWGDFGHVNLFANSMPGMIYGGALSWNPDQEGEACDFYKAISRMEFGEGAENLVLLLSELSKVQAGNWAHIVYWREQKYAENHSLNERIKTIYDLKEDELIFAYNKAIDLEKEIRKLSIYVKHERKLDLLEFINSARGIALINAACLAIKKYDFKQENEIVMENESLAKEIEYWAAGFCDLWRKRNKESELIRIKETIKTLCSFLRKSTSHNLHTI